MSAPIATAALLLSSLTSSAQTAGELLPPGGGTELRIFPQGAYVPNAWIDLADDSVSTWRGGNAQWIGAVNKVASLGRENYELQQQRTIDAGIMSRDHQVITTCTDFTDHLQKDLDHANVKVIRRGKVVFILATIATALAISQFLH